MLSCHRPLSTLLLASLLMLAGQAPLAAPEPAPGNAATHSANNPHAGTTNAPSATDPIMDLLGERGLLRPLGASSAGAVVDAVRTTVRETASDMVMSAMNFLGVPYKRGGTSAETGFDCSGFTRHIFENSIGLVLPRRADEQALSAGLLNIKRQELKPGDLVFFNTMKRTFSHVGIYVGDGKFIHSPRTGGEVRIEDMRESYWARRFTGARRADLNAATPQMATTR